MKERTLVVISVIFVIFGMLGLFFIDMLRVDGLKIGDIGYEDIGNNVKVCGNVSEKYVSKNKHLFFRLGDGSGEIKVVIFNTTLKKIGIDIDTIKNGDSVCVIGNIDIYKGWLEIKVWKVEVV